MLFSPHQCIASLFKLLIATLMQQQLLQYSEGTHKTPHHAALFGEVDKYSALTPECGRVTWKHNTGPFQLLVWLRTQWMGFDQGLNANFLWCWNCTDGLRPLLWPNSLLQGFCRSFHILTAALVPPGCSLAVSPLWLSPVSLVGKHYIRWIYYYFQ